MSPRLVNFDCLPGLPRKLSSAGPPVPNSQMGQSEQVTVTLSPFAMQIIEVTKRGSRVHSKERGVLKSR
jgi:hypothetical protein